MATNSGASRPSTGTYRDSPLGVTYDAFEGANYSANGYYRSEMNCIMFTRTDHFCQVCRQGIIDMIELYSNN